MMVISINSETLIPQEYQNTGIDELINVSSKFE